MRDDALRGQETSGRTDSDEQLERAIEALEEVDWPVGDITAAEAAMLEERLAGAYQSRQSSGADSEGEERRYVDEFTPSPDPDSKELARFLEVFRCTYLPDSRVRFGDLELYFTGSGSGEYEPVWDVQVSGESYPQDAVNPSGFRTARELWDHLCALDDQLPAENGGR